VPKANLPTILDVLDQVTSREAYHHLCKIRPDLDGVQPLQKLIQNLRWKYLTTDRFVKESIAKLLINIPMRQYWTDLLTGLQDIHQLKLLFVAGSCGHFQLFQHRYNSIFGNQHDPNIIKKPSEMPLCDILSYIVLLAAERGYMSIIAFILTKVNNTENQPADHQPQTKPAITLNKDITTQGIYAACKMGHLDILKLLLTLPNGDPTLQQYQHFLFLAVEHISVIKFLLLELPGVDVINISQLVLEYACTRGYIDTVQFVLSNFHYQSLDLNKAVKRAAQPGHFNIVKLLATHGDIDWSLDNNYIIKMAAGFTDLEMIKFLVGMDGVDPSVSDNAPLRKAATRGHLDTVKYLMTLPGVDPTARCNEALREASYWGRLNVVRFLVTLGDVDPTAVDNEAVRNAGERGNLEIVKILLRLPGVDASVCDNEAVRKAAKNGHLDVVKVLVEVPGVDPAACNSEAFRYAAAGGHLDIVKVLSTVPSVDPTAVYNHAVKMAADNGHEEVVKFLLTLPG
ncbi:hypothetical protein HDU76_008316, partial [Blyttiomyces sp. JEL0837]